MKRKYRGVQKLEERQKLKRSQEEEKRLIEIEQEQGRIRAKLIM